MSRGAFAAERRPAPMAVPPGFPGFVPLDSVAPEGEDVRIVGDALFLPTLAMVPIHAVMERTVAYVATGENGDERRMARRSQIAVRPEQVVHGARVDPSKPWKEWRRYETREGIGGSSQSA